MKYKLVKDRLLREDVKNQENLRILYKFMYINLLNQNIVPELIKRDVGLRLSNRLRSKASKTRLVRRCIFTSRARVNYTRFFGMSRMKTREIIQSGMFPGFRKALW